MSATLKALSAITAALVLVAISEAVAIAATPYAPPATEAEDGWLTYRNSPIIDGSGADELDPPPESPEAAVVKFLASKVRGDDAWRDAMTATPSERTERALAAWGEWQLERFQLRGRRDTGPDKTSIRVFFEISIGGDMDQGEDDFEVAREAEGWRIVRPPT